MKPKRPTNSHVARGIGTSTPSAPSWAAFDQLPRKVREAMWEAPVPINPINAQELVELAGVEEAVSALVEAIMKEVRLFAEQHQRRMGYELPHVAAEVSMQRYEVRPLGRIHRGTSRRPLRRLHGRLPGC